MNNKPFAITEEEKGEKVVYFDVSGYIDAFNSAEFGKRMKKALDSGKIYITVNMSSVRFLSSAGIRVILKTYKTVKEYDGLFKIESSSENVANVIGMVNLSEMMTFGAVHGKDNSAGED